MKEWEPKGWEEETVAKEGRRQPFFGRGSCLGGCRSGVISNLLISQMEKLYLIGLLLSYLKVIFDFGETFLLHMLMFVFNIITYHTSVAVQVVNM